MSIFENRELLKRDGPGCEAGGVEDSGVEERMERSHRLTRQ